MEYGYLAHLILRYGRTPVKKKKYNFELFWKSFILFWILNDI